MIRALKQLEAGWKAEDVAREVGVSKHTIYAWNGSELILRSIRALFVGLPVLFVAEGGIRWLACH